MIEARPRLTVVLVAFLLAACTAHTGPHMADPSQPLPPDRLQRELAGLRVGQPVRVGLVDGQLVDGNLLAAVDDSLYLAPSGAGATARLGLARDRVTRLEQRETQLIRTVVLGIGSVAAAALVWFVADYNRDCTGC